MLAKAPHSGADSSATGDVVFVQDADLECDKAFRREIQVHFSLQRLAF